VKRTIFRSVKIKKDIETTAAATRRNQSVHLGQHVFLVSGNSEYRNEWFFRVVT
jgi:hypothetical protein